MDFYTIQVEEKKDGGLVLTPNFVVGRSKDLMVRGGSFYAIWDEEAGVWSTDEYDVGRLLDDEMRKFAEDRYPGQTITIRSMRNYNSKSWVNYRMFLRNVSDSLRTCVMRC
jgi:hypothetical protein